MESNEMHFWPGLTMLPRSRSRLGRGNTLPIPHLPRRLQRLESPSSPNPAPNRAFSVRPWTALGYCDHCLHYIRNKKLQISALELR